MRCALPIVFCIPTFIVLAVIIPVRIAGRFDLFGGWVMVMLGLNFLACTACIAMVLVKPEAREWRAAAIFTSLPFIFFLLAYPLIYLGFR